MFDIKTSKKKLSTKMTMRMDLNAASQTSYTYYIDLLLKCRFCFSKSGVGPKKLHF